MMRKFKKQPKRPRKYNPVRVCDPGDMHAVRLHSRQGVKVVLTNPPKNYFGSLAKVSADAQWMASTNSPYLTLESCNVWNDKIIYNFEQNCDLTNWSEISETYLGSIKIELINNTHPEADQLVYSGAVIGVYHEADSNEVITAINPSNETIKLAPNQTLEVVCYEPIWDEQTPNEHWDYHFEDFEVGEEGVFLEEIKRDWFTCRLIDNGCRVKCGEFTAIPRYCPNVNSLLQDREQAVAQIKLDQNKRPGREYHFWFRFSEASQKKINAIKNGDYYASRVVIKGTATSPSGESLKIERDFLVMLSKHGKPVGIRRMKSKALACINKNSTLWDNPTQREFDRTLQVLINPGGTEQIDFCRGFDDITIELAHPSVYWKSEPSDASWSVEREQGVAEASLNVISKGFVEKFGVKFQRFSIIKKDTVQNLPQDQFLGALRIYYQPKIHAGGERRFSVWYNGAKSKFQQNCSSIYNDTRVTNHYKIGLGNYISPKLAILEIEELPFGSLEDGATTIKLAEVVDIADWDGAFYGIPHPYPTATKKKVTPTVLGNPQKNSETSGNYSTTTNTELTTTQTATTTSEPKIVYNPKHLDQIEVAPGQDIILRLMPPEDVLSSADKEKCRGELWGVNPLFVSDVRPLIVRNCVLPTGTNQYRQEIRIKTDSQRLPAHKGKHCMGAIRLDCSALFVVLRILVNKDVPTQDIIHPLPTNIKFVEEMPFHEAANRKYLLTQAWEHNDSILLNPSDVLYIRQPGMECKLPQPKGDWNCQFVQYPIPPKIWDKLSSDIKEKVDRYKPFYAKDYPVFQNKFFIFKALDQSGLFPALLDALSCIVQEEYFPIATVVFENVTRIQSENEDGITETTLRNKREIHLYVKLNRKKLTPSKPKVTPVHNPIDKADISIDAGSTLSFHFEQTWGSFSAESWKVTSWTTNLQEYGNSNNGTSRVFNFLATLPGEGQIHFEKGNEARCVNIHVRKKHG